MELRAPPLAIIFLILLAPAISDAGETGRTTPVYLGNHHDSEVYYEQQPAPSFLEANRELLHRDTLKLWHFPAVDVTGWDWRNGGIDDMSWWIQVEELRFLLPLLKSGREDDLSLARRWFRSWYEAGQTEGVVNRARWREPMSAAYRGMVLVYFLKIEELREPLDKEMVTLLRDALLTHQEFLADPAHFNANSNHGLVEAFGLLEVTRAFPSSSYEELGLDRLITMCERSVSRLGTHKEHAPPYHFAFLNWIDRFSSYLQHQPQLDAAKIARIVEYADKMRETSYYLRDHDGTIPEIGDADSMNVASRYPAYLDVGSGDEPAVFYDPEAGYAIHKDDRRYLVFTIQNEPPELPFHYHGDAMAVYFRNRGETLLGDPGKYEYTKSRMQRYFSAMSSHNTVLPTRLLTGGLGSRMAKSPALEIMRDDTRYSAELDYPGDFRVQRTVVVREREGGIEVVDRFHRAKSYTSPAPRNVRPVTRPAPRRPAIDNRDRRRRTVNKQPGADGEAKREIPVKPAWGKKATFIWNFGYDVVSVSPVDSGGVQPLVYTFKTREGRRYRFTVEFSEYEEPAPHVAASLIRGQESPLRGWYSPAMFVKRPCYTLLLDVAFSGPATVTTRLEEAPRKYFPGLRILIKGY